MTKMTIFLLISAAFLAGIATATEDEIDINDAAIVG